MIDKVKDWLREKRADFRVFRSSVCQRKVLLRIRNRGNGQKIRVLFYVYDAAKWKCQSVYEAMVRDGEFEPIVAIGLPLYDPVSRSAETAEAAVESLEGFFLDNNCKTVRVVNSFPLDFNLLRRFKPDIVFLQQPWSLPSIYEPYSINAFALPMYVPYYVDIGFDYHLDGSSEFHRNLYCQFTLSENWSAALKTMNQDRSSTVRYIATGHPSLDEISSEGSRGFERRRIKRIIYAPHFSFCHHKNLGPLHIGTFHDNGLEILEYAKRHREFAWIFKPHPALWDKLSNPDIWGAARTRNYYEEWAKLGRVELGGNYSGIFSEADAMVTDCSSFLAEFGTTGKPIIHLVRNHPDALMPHAPERYFDTYYKANNRKEMFALFKMVLEESQDPAKEERLKALNKAGLLQSNAGENIVAYLKQLCNAT